MNAVFSIGYKMLFILYLFVFIACSNISQSKLEKSLASAGKNRYELEKVLKRYSLNPADSLKYKAACFLIENMPDRYYYEGDLLDNYSGYYKALKENENRTPAYILDSIANLYGRFSLNDLQKKYDINEIDSAYLCENIEFSFKLWKEQSWCKNLSFENFCEQILPYRIGNEKLTDWKKVFFKQYIPILNEFKNTNDKCNPVAAAKVLTDSLRKKGVRFTMIAPPGIPPGIDPFSGQYLSGICKNITEFVTAACRSIGIPCALDFVPLRSDANSGHFWVSYYDDKGALYVQDFLGEIESIQDSHIKKAIHPLKVYRNTFAVNNKMVDEMLALDSEIHPLFSYARFKDVSIDYPDNSDTIFIPRSKLYDTKTNAKIAYLCHVQRQQWTPVAWTPFDKNNLKFCAVNKNNLARIATYENYRLVFQSPPFIGDDSGELTFFAPSDNKQNVILLAKTNLEEEERFFKRMIGGVFEGSNTLDFMDKDTLHIIRTAPDRLLTKVDIIPDKPYRYVRYYGADSTNCNVAEITFYEKVCLMSVINPGILKKDDRILLMRYY